MDNIHTTADGRTINIGSGEIQEPKIKHSSYFAERMHQMSLVKDDYTLSFKDSQGYDFSKEVFEAAENGVQINYLHLTGFNYTWKKTGNKWPTNFSRIRLEKTKEYTDKDGNKSSQKYHQEKGSGIYPFLTPGIITKWQSKTQIVTLVVIEGEFKSFKAWKDKQGIECMETVEFLGIPSIHGFDGDTEVKRGIHPDILKVIDECNVVNVVFLTDADTLTVNWKQGKDLKSRQEGFYSAVKYFREGLQAYLDSDQQQLANVFFMNLKRELCASDSKGIDDLLTNLPAKKEEIFKDLDKRQMARDYFEGMVITDPQFTKQLRKHFGLNSPEDFYELYKPFIGNREFTFFNRRYEFDGDKLAYVKHEDVDKYMRVGPDWYKEISILNHLGLLEKQLVPWKIGEITRDYNKYKDFIEHIPKFDSFCVDPAWMPGTYKRKIFDSFNRMDPLTHEIKEGRFDHTIGFLKHIFRGNGNVTWNEADGMYEETAILGDIFTVAMDYLTLQFQQPKQMLIVPILVSKEFETGKTSFIKWLEMIYESNAVILNNQRFQMPFNSHYIDKFIIGLDEGFLDVEKKAEKEKLKNMVTSDTAFLEEKGVNVKKIPYYGKLIISSNDADNVMKIDEGENRWFVVYVPTIDKKDPDLMKKVHGEISAWLHYIATRKIVHPKETRVWFAEKYFLTDQFHKIVNATRDHLEIVFEDWLKEQFLTYQQSSLKYTMVDIQEQLKVYSKYTYDVKKLKPLLEDKFGMKKNNPSTYAFPKGFYMDANGNPGNIIWVKNKGRYYDFQAKDWLSDSELTKIIGDQEPEEQEPNNGSFDMSAQMPRNNEWADNIFNQNKNL